MGFIRYLSLNKKYSGKRANQRIFGFHRELFYFSSAANVFFSQGFRLNPLQMDIITEAGTFFDNHPRRRNKALLLDITFANPCAISSLQNATRHPGKYLADAVKRKKRKYRGSFPANYNLLPLAMSTCGEVGSAVYVFIKELTIRRVEHRLETHSNESQRLVEGTEYHLFDGGSLLFCGRHFHLAHVVISADRKWRLRVSDSSVCKAR